jgi:predicted permease
MASLRLAMRSLAKSPGFTLVTSGLLALGIGASTLIFSVFDAVLVRPLPVQHPESLVRIVQKQPKLPTTGDVPFGYYETLRKYSTTLSSVLGEAQLQISLTEPMPSEALQVYLPTPEYFEALGVHALYGRTLSRDDAKEDVGTPPAVLSYNFWKRRFAGDRSAIGKTLALQGHTFIIVGVLPSGFNGFSADVEPDLRVPLRTLPLFGTSSGHLSLNYVPFELAGRLKAGITKAHAESECLALWRATVRTYYPDHPSQAEFESGLGVALDSLEHGYSILGDRYEAALRLLRDCVALLLLMICANLAGLMLARSATRTEDIAIRLALGATRLRLVWQMLTESLLLSLSGLTGGILISKFLAQRLPVLLPPLRDLGTRALSVSLDLGLNNRVFLFSLVTAIFTVALFGLAPAVVASRTSLDSILRGSQATKVWRGRKVLLSLQIAICTLLLVIAGLLVRTLHGLYQANTGFDRDHVVTFTIDPWVAGWTREETKPRIHSLLERVRQLPFVAGAGLSYRGVMRAYGLGTTVAPAGQRIESTDFLNTSFNVVSPGYFNAMGMRILEGRDFSIEDSPQEKPIKVVVNEALAQKLFAHEDAIRRTFGTNDAGQVAGSTYVIVGVVSNSKYRSMREPMKPIFYKSADDFPGGFVLNVRILGNPGSIIGPVRQTLAAIDPATPLLEVGTLSQEINHSTTGERFMAYLATSFGALAAFLAAIGMYGLLACLLAERVREVGIRMALGARRSDIGALLGKQVLTMTGIGILLGICAAVAIGPWLRSSLYGVEPRNLLVFVEVAIFVLLVVLVGSAVPLTRFLNIEPGNALRQRN